MNTFASIFDSTATFLRGRGISPQITKNGKASLAAIKRFHKNTGILFPDSFSKFFTDFANGYEFRWEKSDDGYGVFSIPCLEQLTKDRQDWQSVVRDFLDDSHSLDQCIDPPFREKAFAIWRKMESWVPFWDEGNGDHFCVETATGQIVYDQHDWFDGFGTIAKTNGVIAGQTLLDFIQNWSRFCFQPNKTLWRGEFAGYGRIEWESDYFNSDFERPG